MESYTHFKSVMHSNVLQTAAVFFSFNEHTSVSNRPTVSTTSSLLYVKDSSSLFHGLLKSLHVELHAFFTALRLLSSICKFRDDRHSSNIVTP